MMRPAVLKYYEDVSTPQSQRQLGAFNKSFPVAQMQEVPRLRLFVFGAGRCRELQSGMTGTDNMSHSTTCLATGSECLRSLACASSEIESV